jgi:hypothetical protein
MITPIGFALKERAAMLDKFISKGLGHKLAMKIAIVSFEFGVFCFQVLYLFLESLRLVGEKTDTLAQDCGAAVLSDKVLEVGKESHN